MKAAALAQAHGLDIAPYNAQEISVGVCIDAQGHMVLLDNTIPSWLPHDQFKDFRFFCSQRRWGRVYRRTPWEGTTSMGGIICGSRREFARG